MTPKSSGHTSSVFILGGGSPKNFMLQTEPQIQEVMGIEEKGHDYFLQCTDARPDTGGLSGATPAEAVSWGKVDPDTLPDCVVCYADSTIALPLLTAYCLSRVKPRKLKRLYDRRDEILDKVQAQVSEDRHGDEDHDEPQNRQTRQRRGNQNRRSRSMMLERCAAQHDAQR